MAKPVDERSRRNETKPVGIDKEDMGSDSISGNCAWLGFQLGRARKRAALTKDIVGINLRVRPVDVRSCDGPDAAKNGSDGAKAEIQTETLPSDSFAIT